MLMHSRRLSLLSRPPYYELEQYYHIEARPTANPGKGPPTEEAGRPSSKAGARGSNAAGVWGSRLQLGFS